MGADSLAKKTPNAPEFICPICLPKPKSSGFQWKKASLGVRSPCQGWNMALQTRKHFWILNLEFSLIHFDTLVLLIKFIYSEKATELAVTKLNHLNLIFFRSHQILLAFSEHLYFMYLSKPFYRWVPNDVFLFDRNAFRFTIVSMLCERKNMQIEFVIKVKSFAVHPEWMKKAILEKNFNILTTSEQFSNYV